VSCNFSVVSAPLPRCLSFVLILFPSDSMPLCIHNYPLFYLPLCL
jgi:hypothetical protein